MAEKILNVRLTQKYDTYENWMQSDPVLLQGEKANVVINVVQEGTANTVPALLTKTGDGTHKFSELNFDSAKAADVYAWAKAATKPSYSAEEITGLEAYISGKVQDTDTQYNIKKINDYKYQLQCKSLGKEEFSDIEGAVIEIPNTDTKIENAINALDVSDTAVDGKYVAAVTEEDGLISVTRADLPDYSTQFNKLTTLIGDDANKSARTIAAEELAAQLIPENANASRDTLEEIAAWIQSHPEDAATMNQSILELKTLVGQLPDSATASDIVNYIQEYCDKKVQDLDDSLAAIAKTGNVNDLVQTAGDVLVLRCGSATVNI